jgi:hypothetical protein
MKKELYFQNPKQTPKLRRVDSAYSDLSVINIAAANSGAANGVFTPKQFSTAVRQSDMTRNKSAFAKGTAKSQQISDAAVQVLGNQAQEQQWKVNIAASRVIGGLWNVDSNLQIAAGLINGCANNVQSNAGQSCIGYALLRSRPDLVKQAGGMLGQVCSPSWSCISPKCCIYQYNTSERLPPQLRFPTDKE